LKIVEKDKPQNPKELYSKHIVVNQQSKSNKQQNNKRKLTTYSNENRLYPLKNIGKNLSHISLKFVKGPPSPAPLPPKRIMYKRKWYLWSKINNSKTKTQKFHFPH
jgi:hypothetical protein